VVARFALALVSALIALGATCAGALADSSADVLVSAIVHSSSGTTVDSVTLAALQADPTRCPAYSGPETMHELGRQGFVDVPLPPSGAQTGTWALSTALACMQTPIPVNAVQGIAVLGFDGSPQAGAGSDLKPADLASPSDFNDTTQGPVVEALGSLNQYDRPWRGGTDQDFLDEVQQSQNGQPLPISIEVFEGPLLTVTVTASATSVPAGGTVSFHATVGGAGASALSYAWSFGGAAPGSTASAPSVRFDSAGRYAVTVQVTNQTGGGGVASIPITVGGQPPAATGTHPQIGAGTALGSHFPTGPRQSAGHHPGGQPGSTNAGASTPSRARPRATTTPSAPPTTPASTTATTTTPTAPAPLPNRAAAPQRTRPAPAHIQPRRLARPAPLSAPKGPVVAGRLISDVIPLGPGASPLIHIVPSTVAGAPPARQAIRASLLPGIGAALAVIVLLGLGAARELGWPRGWRAPGAGS